MAGSANWFIALPIVSDQLSAGMIADLPPQLRRLDPADLHVTVAFLGAVGERRALATWTETAAMQAGPFEVRTGAPAALGRPRRPSAYGLDLVAEAGFTEWLAYWRDRLRAAAGVEPETRSVRPHVTLARPPRRADAGIHQRARTWTQTTRPTPATLCLDRIALYTAADGPGQRRYQAIRERPLRAANAGGDAENDAR